MNERQNSYDFCPKCGAVMQNGVCQSCGYGKRMNTSWGNDTAWQEHQPSTPKRKKGMSTGAKVVLILCIVLFVLLAMFIIFAANAFVSQTKDVIEIDEWGNPSTEEAPFDLWDDYSGGYIDSEDGYVPNPKDEYYIEIVDATVDHLDYSIEWQDVSIWPDDHDSSEYYYSSCPMIRSEDAALVRKVNGKLREVSSRYQDSYWKYADGVDCTSNVTYMSDKVMSVVFQNHLYGEDGVTYEIDAITFDMTTGEVIPYRDMLSVDADMVERFRKQNELQNGPIEFVDGCSDEDLLGYISSDQKRVVFYTPVGLELGFNYTVEEDDVSGWVTVTLKEYGL